MTPESNPNSPERLASDMLHDLRAGNLSALRAKQGIGEFLRTHSSDPAVRAAAVQGIIESTGLLTELGMADVRNALGLTDEEFQTPEARRTARKRMEDSIKHGDFKKVALVEAVVRLGPDYFSNPETLDRIETGIEQAFFSFHRPAGTFTELAKLPIPAEFYRRPRVMEAAGKVQQQALSEGLPDAVTVMRHVGIEAFSLERLRLSARNGITVILKRGDYRTYREYADLFGFQNDEADPYAVRAGFFNLISLGQTDAAVDFASHFPNLGEFWKAGADLQKVAMLGIRHLLVDSNFSEADRLTKFGGVSHDLLLRMIRPTIEILLEQGNGPILKQVQERWDISSDHVHDGAASAIEKRITGGSTDGIWDDVVRIRETANLSEGQFEDAFTKGQVAHMDRLGYGYDALSYDNWKNRIRKIHALRTEYPIDPAFAERLERDVAFAFVRKILLSNVPGRVADARKEFTFLDVPTVRRAAVEAANEALDNTIRGASQTLRTIQASLHNIGARPLAYADVAEKAEAYVFSDANYLDPDAFTDLFDDPQALPATGDERDWMLDAMREKVRSNMLFAENGNSQMRPYLFELYGLDWETFPLRDIPLKLLLNPDDDFERDALRERAKSDPWARSLSALAKIQGRSANEEHDPWEQELFPLVDRATREEAVLDRNSEADGALLVEYVKTFGMMNLPNVSCIFFGLKRGPFASLPEAGRAQLIELIGPKAARMESENLINELRMLKLALQRDLLADVVPRKVGTTLGEEVFLIIRGSTEWEQSDRPSEVFKAWKETVERETAEIVRLEREVVEAIDARDEMEATRLYAVAWEKRELIAVAPGYEESRFAVAKLYRGKEAPSDEQIWAAVASPETIAALSHYETAVAPFLVDELESTESTLLRLEAQWRDRNDAADGTDPPDSFVIQELSAQDDLAFVAYMEEIAMTPNDEFLLALSATHLSILAPEQWFLSLHRTAFNGEADAVSHRAAFVTQYLKEHYLNRNQDQSHTGHAPFSEPLRLALERAWQAEGDATTNAILKTNAAIEALRAKQMGVSTETVDVALVPVQGPLRMYAGDIGDACYSKQHGALSRGEYPRLKTMVFVTNRGNSRERLNGSVLFVETSLEETDERVIVIRANNPRQNLVAQLDAPSLVRQTIDTAIATAKRRQIKHVGVVRDEASQASSNREAVSGFYGSEYKHNATARLVLEPETNFNGYDIWDDTGDHPTVIVWTNDDPEAT